MMLGTRLERLLMISRERHWLDYATGGFVFLAAVGGIAAAILPLRQKPWLRYSRRGFSRNLGVMPQPACH